MQIFLMIISFIVFIALLIVAAMRPKYSEFSVFELERRIELGDKNAKKVLTRDNLLIDVISLQRVCVTILLVVFVLISIVTFGWLVGAILSLFIALEYGAIARLKLIRNLSQKIYNRFEKNLLSFICKAPYLFKVLRSVSTTDRVDYRINSRAELQHIIDASAGVLTSDEKKMIVSSLSFSDQLVGSIMTPRSVIDYVKSTEFLGPLTLDDLHKTGHSRLPVIKVDIDHIIGMLNLKSMLSLDTKKSMTAEKAMDPKVYYIRQDQTLKHALAAFLRTHHHLFVVVNEFRETVGLLALEDVIEVLLGRKIIDEFDAHEDLRAVALHNPHDNNQPEKSEDI